MTPELSADEIRLLVVLYKLSNGKANVPISEAVIVAECEKDRVFEMTDEQFNVYHRKVLNVVKMSQN